MQVHLPDCIASCKMGSLWSFQFWTGELPYWENEWSQHAAVVVGMTESTILLNDPVFKPAPIGISLGDFDLAWLAQDETFAVITPA